MDGRLSAFILSHWNMSAFNSELVCRRDHFPCWKPLNHGWPLLTHSCVQADPRLKIMHFALLPSNLDNPLQPDLNTVKAAQFPCIYVTMCISHMHNQCVVPQSPSLVFPLSASSSSPRATSDLEQARPQTSGEEELQLQLALAMSREESEKVKQRTQTLTTCLIAS